MILETIALNPTYLFMVIVGLFILLQTIPRFTGRRRIFSGIIAALTFQLSLIIFNFQPTFETLKFAIFAATLGSVIKQEVDKLVK